MILKPIWQYVCKITEAFIERFILYLSDLKCVINLTGCRKELLSIVGLKGLYRSTGATCSIDDKRNELSVPHVRRPLLRTLPKSDETIYIFLKLPQAILYLRNYRVNSVNLYCVVNKFENPEINLICFRLFLAYSNFVYSNKH